MDEAAGARALRHTAYVQGARGQLVRLKPREPGGSAGWKSQRGGGWGLHAGGPWKTTLWCTGVNINHGSPSLSCALPLGDLHRRVAAGIAEPPRGCWHGELGSPAPPMPTEVFLGRPHCTPSTELLGSHHQERKLA